MSCAFILYWEQYTKQAWRPFGPHVIHLSLTGLQRPIGLFHCPSSSPRTAICVRQKKRKEKTVDVLISATLLSALFFFCFSLSLLSCVYLNGFFLYPLFSSVPLSMLIHCSCYTPTHIWRKPKSFSKWDGFGDSSMEKANNYNLYQPG